MKKFISFTTVLLTIIFNLGCSNKSNEEQLKMPALFDSRVEAEKAAKRFNCTGAHKMGNKWMPCSTHEAHESSHNKTKKDHNHHHHH